MLQGGKKANSKREFEETQLKYISIEIVTYRTRKRALRAFVSAVFMHYMGNKVKSNH